MAQLHLSGTWDDATDFLQALLKAGFLLGYDFADSLYGQKLPVETDILLVAVTQEEDIPYGKNSWLAWLRKDDPDLSIAAYKAGALAVFPYDLSSELLIESITRFIRKHNKKELPADIVRHINQGEPIFLDPGHVIIVNEGVLATMMVHVDGTQVLLGLTGTGNILIGHPDDDCYIKILAHTPVVVTFLPWERAITTRGFAENLKIRLQQMEAWAAMQARPNLNLRVLGILCLLAEQFGLSHPDGTIINVRLTQTQLASAVGTTRTTISRVLGELSAFGSIKMEGKGKNGRIVLCQKVESHHTWHPKNVPAASCGPYLGAVGRL